MRARVVRDLTWLEALARQAVKLARGRWDGEPRDGGNLDTPVWRARVEGCLLQMLYLLEMEDETAGSGWRDPRVEALADRIVAEPGADWRVDVMARDMGYSRTHFSRVFREQVGDSPKRFLIKTRIQRATEILRETTLQVQEVAEQLGYQDVFFFSRQFKREMGVAPSNYREEG